MPLGDTKCSEFFALNGNISHPYRDGKTTYGYPGEDGENGQKGAKGGPGGRGGASGHVRFQADQLMGRAYSQTCAGNARLG